MATIEVRLFIFSELNLQHLQSRRVFLRFLCSRLDQNYQNFCFARLELACQSIRLDPSIERVVFGTLASDGSYALC